MMNIIINNHNRILFEYNYVKNNDWCIHIHYYANMIKNVESPIQYMNKTSEIGLIARENQ